MPRKLRVPAYRMHKQSGQAITTLVDSITKQRKDFLLGSFDSDESKQNYDRLIAEWIANGRRFPGSAKIPSNDLTINQLILNFWTYASNHYRRPDGSSTQELADYKNTLRPLAFLFGDLIALDFGPSKLKAVRNLMIEGYYHPKYGDQPKLCRRVINQRIGRIVRMFKWSVSEELLPGSIVESLRAVKGLESGRSEAFDHDPVTPVSHDIVEKTIPFLRPQVAAMVQLQLLTGARPAEICSMRGIDINTSGNIWEYRPQFHKTAHRGKHRVIFLGPKAQKIVKKWLRTNQNEYLFQPKESMQSLYEETRKKPKPKRRRKFKPHFNDKYTTSAYGKAIRRGVEQANKSQACENCKPLNPEERCENCRKCSIPYWHAHQLRHTHGTRVRKAYGLESAQIILGHTHAQVTEIYAERDLSLAEKIAEEIG